MWRKRRFVANETVESLMLICILGVLAVTVLSVMANTMSGVAAQHANPMIQSVTFQRWMN